MHSLTCFQSKELILHSLGLMPSRVKIITAPTFDEFVDSDGLRTFIVFTSLALGGQTPAIVKAASTIFENRLTFGEIKPTETRLDSQFNVTSRPMVAALNRIGEIRVVMTEALTIGNLTAFLERALSTPHHIEL